MEQGAMEAGIVIKFVLSLLFFRYMYVRGYVDYILPNALKSKIHKK